MKRALLGAVALTLATGAAHAATYEYDFKSAANVGGGIGESIYSEFNTDTFFAGPNLKVTATKPSDDDSNAYVYFDAGNAGMGVCGDPTGSAVLNTATNGGGNLCNPSSDDGLTTDDETLHFEATNQAVRITSFSINSNHDDDSVLDTIWKITSGAISATYDFADFIKAPGFNDADVDAQGDVTINVDFLLNVGDKLTFEGVSGANSYISAIGVSAVPLPAAGMMLLAGLGGFGALRARRKS